MSKVKRDSSSEKDKEGKLSGEDILDEFELAFNSAIYHARLAYKWRVPRIEQARDQIRKLILGQAYYCPTCREVHDER